MKRRRPMKPEEESQLRDHSYSYKVHVQREGNNTVEIPVCYKAFMNLYGITNENMIKIKKTLSTTGYAPINCRGTHTNRPMKKNNDAVQKVITHISSLQEWPSHYCLQKSSKFYLPEELNIINYIKCTQKNSEYPV